MDRGWSGFEDSGKMEWLIHGCLEVLLSLVEVESKTAYLIDMSDMSETV